MNENIKSDLQRVVKVTLKGGDVGMTEFDALSTSWLLDHRVAFTDDMLESLKKYNIYNLVYDYLITKEYIDEKLYGDCERIVEYTDYYININDFLNGKEPELYKSYKIPVIYCNWGLVDVMGKSLEDAMKIAIDNTNMLPLPEYPDYMDDSIMVDIDVIEKDINSSKDLTDEDIVILTEFYNQFN